MESASDRFTPVDTLADDPAVIIYTSGTTGQLKGALLKQKLAQVMLERNEEGDHDPKKARRSLAVRKSKSERSIRMTLSLAFMSPALAEVFGPETRWNCTRATARKPSPFIRACSAGIIGGNKAVR